MKYNGYKIERKVVSYEYWAYEGQRFKDTTNCYMISLRNKELGSYHSLREAKKRVNYLLIEDKKEFKRQIKDLKAKIKSGEKAVAKLYKQLDSINDKYNY